jgi:hypothetical protein
MMTSGASVADQGHACFQSSGQLLTIGQLQLLLLASMAANSSARNDHLWHSNTHPLTTGALQQSPHPQHTLLCHTG